METIDRKLSKGDILEIGETVESSVEQTRDGIRLIAVYSGETKEYVILTTRFTDGEEITVPEEGQILAVTDGNQRANPVCWMLVPRDAYGGAE